MILGVRERNKRAKSFRVYCRDKRITTLLLSAVLEGKGCIVYSLRSLMPRFPGAQEYRIMDDSSSKGS